MRVLPGSLPAAGYFILKNDSDTPATLVAARSPLFEAVMIHRTVERDGQSRMERVATLEVPAHGELRFSPGGYHLMLLRARRAPRSGEAVPVVLEFSGGEKLSAAFEARAPGER